MGIPIKELANLTKKVDEAAEIFWQHELAIYMPRAKKIPDAYYVMFRAGAEFVLEHVARRRALKRELKKSKGL